ncbi:hypothetical protein BIWAKO_02244 [Bosea sp. BIWAKO-01]|nr:hypothetical protein BIWAKO_02244 [Bosea sp. BIWAKO-01]
MPIPPHSRRRDISDPDDPDARSAEPDSADATGESRSLFLKCTQDR